MRLPAAREWVYMSAPAPEARNTMDAGRIVCICLRYTGLCRPGSLTGAWTELPGPPEAELGMSTGCNRNF